MIRDCRIVELPNISGPDGDLTFLESARHIPFRLRRVYVLHGLRPGARRGGHAHGRLQQLVVAVSGSFDVLLDDGCNAERYQLNNPSRGLYISPLIWRVVDNISESAVCMVCASEYYDETDYIRRYEDFQQLVAARARAPG